MMKEVLPTGCYTSLGPLRGSNEKGRDKWFSLFKMKLKTASSDMQDYRVSKIRRHARKPHKRAPDWIGGSAEISRK